MPSGKVIFLCRSVIISRRGNIFFTALWSAPFFDVGDVSLPLSMEALGHAVGGDDDGPAILDDSRRDVVWGRVRGPVFIYFEKMKDYLLRYCNGTRGREWRTHLKHLPRPFFLKDKRSGLVVHCSGEVVVFLLLYTSFWICYNNIIEGKWKRRCDMSQELSELRRFVL